MTEADSTPLSREDLTILDLECETIAGHTCKVIVLGEGAPSVDAVRDRVAARIDATPQLTWRLGGESQAPAWVADPTFDLTAHVVAPLAGPIDESELAATVSELFAQHLERERPLWRLDVVSLRAGGVALVWRIHHALADGTTAMRLARQVLFDPVGEQTAAASRHASSAGRAADDARRRAHLGGFLGREFSRSRGRSPFDGRVGTERRVAFATTPLAPLHDAAKSLCAATVNDAVLASVAGGLRSWIEAHHGTLQDLRVRVPVSLHHEGDDAGNRDSFFAVALPLSEPDPVERLRAVHAETSARKSDHDAETLDQLHRDLTRASPHLETLWSRVEASPRRFALNVSNVPGPRTAVSVDAAPVRELHSIAEIGERHALRVAVVSYAGDLCFGLCADPAIVDGLDALAEGIETEAATLVEVAP